MDFLVLPDHPAGDRLASLLPHDGERRLTHASGRPWILGRWADGQAVQATAGDNRVVVLGFTSADTGTLERRLSTVRTVADLDALARTLPGAFHLVASIGGEVRAQGSVSTACQIFHGAVDGISVAADRPQTVASFTGAGVQEDRLALQLLSPFGPPWPLSLECLWRGVHAVPPGHCLVIRPNGSERTRRWWREPHPDLPLSTGATVLREVLQDAVDARTRGGGVLSADFSGGMDSTSLCFLAARTARQLVTVHYRSLDPTNDDNTWASRCADGLTGARHVVVPAGEAPTWYSKLSAADPDLEGPLPFVRSRAQTEHLARLVAGLGATRHLQGIGGDELFHPSALHLHALVRRHPIASIPYVRTTRSMRRWSLRTTLRTLMGGASYAGWMAGTTARFAGERGPQGRFDWELAPMMPPWATADAVEAARRLVMESAARCPEPLSPLPVHHEMLRLLQVDGWAVRRNARIAAQFGVALQAPYLDDRVIETAMSIRLTDRMRAGQQKHVLGSAMRGVVPHVLDRTTKGDASAELYAGLREHRRELSELCDDSRLVRLGLADADALRAVVLGSHSDTRPLMPFDPTLATELWLRALHARQPSPRR